MNDRFYALLEKLFLEIDQDDIVRDLERLRKERPHSSVEQLADELTRRAARKAAVTGVGAGATGGPIGILAMAPDIFNLVRLQSRLILSIAFLYGRKPHLKQRFREVLATLAISSGAAASRQTVRLLIQKSVEGQLAKNIVRKIAGRFAVKRLPAAVPLIGGVAGGALNYAAVKATGRTAVAFYTKAELEEESESSA
jgi:hypothetical protein